MTSPDLPAGVDLAGLGAMVAAQLAANPDRKPAELGAELARQFLPMLPLLPPPVAELLHGFASEVVKLEAVAS